MVYGDEETNNRRYLRNLEREVEEQGEEIKALRKSFERIENEFLRIKELNNSLKDNLKMKNIEKFIADNPRFKFHVGECGFGRPCVGIMEIETECYLDYTSYTEDWEVRYSHNVSDRTQPKNAYHKHPCLAVLINDEADQEEATRQLNEWMGEINKAGYEIKEYKCKDNFQFFGLEKTLCLSDKKC